MPKINSEYDIGATFEAIEDELIASMIRNMRRHKIEEIDEDKQWSMWQTEQLRALEKYRKENQSKFGAKFKDINKKIEALISTARDEGDMDQEIAILEAIKKGFPARKVSHGASAAFFRLNQRKLEALIHATTSDMEKAETAVLRMANDQYRNVIFNAQVYANSGAGTYEKAVDMATKDFVAAGLNCVEYANGARHTLADYADMAIRTASKRAYLQGEGQKRQEWGISTVIMNKRGNPCPKCLPFVGKILIDDVWSGGSAKDGPYPLMSAAIAAGLYHPRCKDSHTTYFPELEDLDNEYSKKDIEDIEEQNRQEARQQYAERQEKKFHRLASFSLDSENRDKYANKQKEWDREVLKQKNRGEKVVITEQAIDKVNVIEPKGLTSDNNQFIKKVHKALLKIAKTENDSNEVASIVNLIENERSGFIKGDRHSVNVYADSDAYHRLVTETKHSLVICHNHPGLTDFSANDIGIFMRHNSIKTMTIVSNLGKVSYISKAKDFDYRKATLLMRDSLEQSGMDVEKGVEIFLKKCYSVGIERGD